MVIKADSFIPEELKKTKKVGLMYTVQTPTVG